MAKRITIGLVNRLEVDDRRRCYQRALAGLSPRQRRLVRLQARRLGRQLGLGRAAAQTLEQDLIDLLGQVQLVARLAPPSHLQAPPARRQLYR